MKKLKQQAKYLVAGLGKTGIAAIKYLLLQGYDVSAYDFSENGTYATEALNLLKSKKICFGSIDKNLIDSSDYIVVSPGIPNHSELIKYCRQLKKQLISDIDIFISRAEIPIIAITGTNGKTTVTTLVTKIIKNNGYKVLTGGNIGVPVLDLLSKDSPDYYVLELSSFQLHYTKNNSYDVAALLNITPDHLDWHLTYDEYCNSKFKIFENCKTAVINKNLNLKKKVDRIISFSLKPPKNIEEFGITQVNSRQYLSNYNQQILDISKIKLSGTHNIENVLAALSIAHSVGIINQNTVNTIKSFSGLKHRCQLVKESSKIKWYNDSKATNIGSTIASVMGLGSLSKKNIILIIGGIGKGQDFKNLSCVINDYVKHSVIFGKDKFDISKSIPGTKSIVNSLEEGVSVSKSVAIPGDTVILAPACSSFDMFKNFEHRGIEFEKIVRQNC